MKDQKEMLLDVLYQQITSNAKAGESFKKEFNIDDKTFKKMVRKFLYTWLESSPEMIVLLTEMMSMYDDAGEDGGMDYYG